MKFTNYLCSFFIVLLLIMTVTSCRPAAKKNTPAEEEPLLLLEEPTGDLSAAEGADNSRCHVCHFNFAMEKLAVTHAKVDVSCEDCHGPSDEHCSDEDNITPPDKMFPKGKINPSCLHCHGNTLKKTNIHKKVIAGTLKKTCTDCHGKHKMSHRTRIWNKETGELISDDKVRMLTDEMLME